MYGRILSLVLVLSGGVVLTSQSLAQDIGLEGPSYVGAGSFPTASKPQSKLWFHDGAWWGSLFSSTDRVFRIHRLDPATSDWVDTGTTIDPRHTSHSDCLSDGNRLYVGSHHFQEGGSEGFPLRVYRFTYDTTTDSYALDAGFPAQLSNTSTEGLVIEKDSTGVVWAVWTFDLRVWVSHTLGNDLTWVDPFVLPVNTTDVDADDICSIVRFGGNRIGVMWSDHETDAYYFTVHQDGAPAAAWSTPEEALAGPQQADDHIHVKAAADGRVLAAVKNALDETWLRVRATNGTWTGHLLSSPQDGWTRTMFVLDEQNGRIHAFGTQPILGGSIYTKQSPLGAIAFPSGRGTAFLQVANDLTLNDATSTKQSLNATTDLALLASRQGTRHYWYRVEPISGGAPTTPKAGFRSAPTSGTFPLRVEFTDQSTGNPATWSWSFGDGATSSDPNPVHVYDTPGRYSVTLAVSSPSGSDQLTRANYITVTSGPPGTTVKPLEDTYVKKHGRQRDHGHERLLRVRSKHSRSEYESFLKFDLGSAATGSAILRLHCRAARERAQVEIYLVASDWSPPGLTWNKRPALPVQPLATTGALRKHGWVEIDLGAALAGGGIVSLAIVAADDDKVQFSSTEGPHAPELVFR